MAAPKGSFTADQVLWILATIGLVKVLHELGHAVACKHFGGECHELGLMLFVGVPSLYCNVSDAWMLPGKRPRILITPRDSCGVGNRRNRGLAVVVELSRVDSLAGNYMRWSSAR